MKIATCVFVVLCLIDVSMVMTQLITQTPCAYFGTAPMPNFNKDLYQGQWFTHQHYDWPGSEEYDCYVKIRTPTADGNQNLTELLVHQGLPHFQSDGVTTFDMPGYGLYTYRNTQNPFPNSIMQYQILHTDYFNYAIVWSCTPISSGNKCFLFINSRSPVVTAATQSRIDSILDKHHISKTELRTLDITSCPAELLEVPGGTGLLERVLQIVAGLVATVVGAVGGLLGGVLG